MRSALFPLLLLLSLLLAGCSNSKQEKEIAASIAETELLLAYLEENGNFLNSPVIPALIDAEDVHQMLAGANMHIIDLRSSEEFNASHIQHSVNVKPKEILHHFEQRIEPGSFDHIVLVCPNAQLSGYVNAVLLFLGYDNVRALRFGLSSWDEKIAKNHWLAAIGNDLEGKLDTQSHPKNEPGELPALATGYTDGYQILRSRAKAILDTNLDDLAYAHKYILENPEKFYLGNYWPEALYNSGHLPGAIQYTPKSSLHSAAYIRTLPTDRPVVMYCFTAQHSSYVTAFLRLLGYDAYNLAYGANSFIHNTMVTTQRPTRSFTEATIGHFPLSGEEGGVPVRMDKEQTQDNQPPVIGGC